MPDRRSAPGTDAPSARSPFERAARFRGGLGSQLLGIEPRRTRVGILGLCGLGALHLVDRLAAIEIAGRRAQTLTPAFDTLSMVLILASLIVAIVGPFAYAYWNGGPALAFAVALVPSLVGELLARRWVIDVDLAVALTAGAAGAAVALCCAEIRRTGSGRPWRRRTPPRGAALFVAVAVAVSAALVARFILDAPDGMLAAYRPFAPLWAVPLGVAAAYARARVRRIRVLAG